MVSENGMTVAVTVNGRKMTVGSHDTVAAAVAQAGLTASRRSVTGHARGPLCGVGLCMECVVTIDSCSGRLSCQTLCREGMVIVTGEGNDHG